MLASMPGYMVDQWRYFFALEPPLVELIDKHLAALFVLYHNAHCEHKNALQLSDRRLMTPIEEPPQMTPEQRMQAEQANARAAADADRVRRGG